MNKFQQFMRDTRAQLLLSLRKSATLDHNGLKGTARERFIHEFLESSFPKKFVFGSGEIFDSKGSSSPQSDIVIYDETMPVLHHGGGVSQFMAEGVLAHVEVKTSLDKSEIAESLTKAARISSLHFGVMPNMTVGKMRGSIPSFVVSYAGPSKETFKSHVVNFYTANPTAKKVAGVFVLEQGYVAILDNDDLAFAVFGEDVLLQAFLLLYQALWKNWSAYPSFQNYISGQFQKF